ncbi:hypothetical protein [Paramagnetospirillum magneticum]|nr:hypothetical protein [Paramagnetospirillum magneticum]
MRDLRSLYNECRDLGAVSDQRSFSRMFGRQASWCSSTLARGRRPTTGALVAFVLQLEKIIVATEEEMAATINQEEVDALRGGLDEITRIKAEVWSEVEIRSQLNLFG